jgi:pyridoxal phosphate enzyme (YggS family)
MSIKSNIDFVNEKKAAAAIKSGRKPEDVLLVAVTKLHTPAEINEAIDAGITDIGENKVQEIMNKYEDVKPVRWHLIGHLQTNKVKQIVPFVHMIHSVDSVRLLETINREAEKIRCRVKVLLEVHVAKEASKSGFTPEEFLSLITHSSSLISAYPWVEICGVMGMATNTDDKQEWRSCFREIKHLASSLIANSSPSERPQISMGMSDDYQVAIEEGSTMVRIGSTIFGSRNY